MNSYLTTVGNQFECDVVLSRLEAEGIYGWASVTGTPRLRVNQHEIYVDGADLQRARKVLDEAGSIDEAELARLSEEAGPPPPD